MSMAYIDPEQPMDYGWNLSTTLHCSHKSCKDCLQCWGINKYEAGLQHSYMCDKFGDKCPHGLVMAKFCDQFRCDCPDLENNYEKCITCRGYTDYEEG